MKSWVPIDAIVTSDTSPGDEYVEWPDLSVTGPDADGLVWVHANAEHLQGDVSVRVDSIAGRALLACRARAALATPGAPDDAE